MDARIRNDACRHCPENLLQLCGGEGMAGGDMGKGDRFAGKPLAADHPVEGVLEASGQSVHVFGHCEKKAVGRRDLGPQIPRRLRQKGFIILIRREMRQTGNAGVSADADTCRGEPLDRLQQRQI